jgi:hypothetical protein
MRTTFQTRNGWSTPPRAPLHAAPQPAVDSPAAQRARWALRLFATGGVWAAGLCLVVGLLVLVASAVSPGRGTRLATDSAPADSGDRAPDRVANHDGDHRAGDPASGSSAPARGTHRLHSPTPASPGQTGHRSRSPRIATFSGHGDFTTRALTVGAKGNWQIAWSYRCPATLPVGLFVVADAAPGTAGATINESGASGRGDTWLHADGGGHRLVVISTCSWTMKVTANS